eukprot:CAMPEP_0206489100 /NCGR_PEP_ID=MMETSP0324_2-20121206/42938_1 /ASSEMBLY_ACC=CAM_ASM_000836 /TAXON_ID=2866 /ORGANISM="Crypthecodinium cohnii, Strain Seligo" /LENGTH=333 /DNA_ID=CAMNT_0053968513 /DNA_START=170 /DNA_END=1168 /DNA_ORIENTATION=+
MAAPGMLMRQRPRVEVSLGPHTRQTNLGEFSQPSEASRSTSSKRLLGQEANYDSNDRSRKGPPQLPIKSKSQRKRQESQWRFGDTITLAAGLRDILGPGLHIRLTSQSEVILGPLQLDLAGSQEIAHGLVDLQERILRVCVHDSPCEPDGLGDADRRVWSSPIVLIPLSSSTASTPDAGFAKNPGSSCSHGSESHSQFRRQLQQQQQGQQGDQFYPYQSPSAGDTDMAPNLPEAAAYLAVSFSLSVDPEMLQHLAQESQKSFFDRISVGSAIQGAGEQCAQVSYCSTCETHGGGEYIFEDEEGFYKRNPVVVRQMHSAEAPTTPLRYPGYVQW